MGAGVSYNNNGDNARYKPYKEVYWDRRILSSLKILIFSIVYVIVQCHDCITRIVVIVSHNNCP
jgi:hypothetical protein